MSTEKSLIDGHDDLLKILGPHLAPGEEVAVAAPAIDSMVVVTDRRLLVTADQRVALEVAFGELRRIQFDIERDRPATLVIVPESARHEVQVLAVPTAHIRAVTDALVIVSHRFAESS